eukprot:928448-Amphidinium_carterae.1
MLQQHLRISPLGPFHVAAKCLEPENSFAGAESAANKLGIPSQTWRGQVRQCNNTTVTTASYKMRSNDHFSLSVTIMCSKAEESGN